MLLYANMSKANILLHNKLTTLECAYPHTLCIIHTLDNPSLGWTDAVGYISHKLISIHILPAKYSDKIKVVICSILYNLHSPICFIVCFVWLTLWNIVVIGLPR